MLVFRHEDKSCEFDSDSMNLREVIKALGLDSKKVIAATLDNIPHDLAAAVTTGGEVSAITTDSPEGLEILRHSTAHLMAQAVLRLYPGSHFGVGPAIKDGFYYDIDATGKIGRAHV